MTATAAGAFAAQTHPRAEAAPRNRDGALPVGLFTELAAAAIPTDVMVIETSGYERPGVGSARYAATHEMGAAPYRARTADGRWFELAEPLVFLEMFGALGDDPWRDDGPAIQSAVDYVASKSGGVVWCTPGRIYYVGATLVINPTRVSIEGGGAVWDFRLKAFHGRGEPEGAYETTTPKDGFAASIADNACILVRVPPDGTQYGHDSHYCRGLKVKGPPTEPHVADGFYFDTPTRALSSRWTLQSVEAVENLGRGMVLGNRAYVVKAYASSFVGFHAGVEFLGGEDAGENFSFFGGALGSSGGPALKNHGGEFYLFGVSTDFPKAFIHQTGGTTHCFGCHFETGSRAGFGGRPFDIAGELYIDGGQIMGGAPLDGTPIPYDTFFYTRDIHSRIVLSNVWGYNWQGAQHIMCGGPGRFVVERLLGGTNWNIPGIVKRDPSHSLVGDAGLFEQPESSLDLWVEGQGASRRHDRDHVVWSNQAQDFGSLKAERSTADFHSGTASLAVTKAGLGVGTGAGLNILIPFPIGGNRLRAIEFWIKIVPKADNQSVILFTQLFWANVIGRDSFSVPKFGQTKYSSEFQLTIPGESNRANWSRVAYGDPLYTDFADPDGGYAPVWATHLWLTLNLVNFPPSVLFFDDFYAFAI